MITLCNPTEEMTCFGCCPPIRPAHYDHLDHVGILRREFSENRRVYLESGPERRPIAGFHCWALGFLDASGRRVGCLLHPLQNGGKDLRNLVDYGSKCAREICIPARMFAVLSPQGRSFWLPLAEGLSPFFFSSPRANPLFHLLLWGPDVLEALRSAAEKRGRTCTELLREHPFLLDPAWRPRAHRYLFRLALQLPAVMDDGRLRVLEKFCNLLLARLTRPADGAPSPDVVQPQIFTHQLPMAEDFLDFLRIGLGIRKTSWRNVLEVEARVHEAFECCAEAISNFQ